MIALARVEKAKSVAQSWLMPCPVARPSRTGNRDKDHGARSKLTAARRNRVGVNPIEYPAKVKLEEEVVVAQAGEEVAEEEVVTVRLWWKLMADRNRRRIPTLKP